LPPADDIDRLYAVRPADFVRERGALAKALKGAGRRDEAAAVEKIPRPSSSVWAVNQIARGEPELVRRLGAVTARLQSGAAGYPEAMAEHRELLKELRAKAEDALAAGGIRATPELLARVVHDLRAGIMDPATRPLVESGRLVHDVAEETDASPFAGAPAAGAGAAQTAAPDRPKPTLASVPAPAAREAARALAEARAARARRLTVLRTAVTSARAADERAARAVIEARATLDGAERARESSRSALAEAEAALAAEEAEPS
jgi:hypothetical protein